MIVEFRVKETGEHITKEIDDFSPIADIVDVITRNGHRLMDVDSEISKILGYVSREVMQVVIKRFEFKESYEILKSFIVIRDCIDIDIDADINTFSFSQAMIAGLMISEQIRNTNVVAIGAELSPVFDQCKNRMLDTFSNPEHTILQTLDEDDEPANDHEYHRFDDLLDLDDDDMALVDSDNTHDGISTTSGDEAYLLYINGNLATLGGTAGICSTCGGYLEYNEDSDTVVCTKCHKVYKPAKSYIDAPVYGQEYKPASKKEEPEITATEAENQERKKALEKRSKES